MSTEPTRISPAEHFSADADLKHPLQTLRSICTGFWRGRHLALRLTIRGIRSEYVNLRFGFLWNFAEPVIYAVVFAVLRKGQAFHAGGIEVPFSTFVLSGMVAYQIFCQAVQRPLMIPIDHKSLITQTRIPPEAMVLSTFLRLLFDAFFFFVVLVATCYFTGVFNAGSSLLFLFAIPLLALLGMAIGLLVCPFNLVVNDLGRATASVLRVLMFVSPIFYHIPDTGFLSVVNVINPLATFISSARDLLFFGEIPGGAFLIVFCGVTPVLFLIACITFHVSIPVVADRL